VKHRNRSNYRPSSPKAPASGPAPVDARSHRASYEDFGGPAMAEETRTVMPDGTTTLARSHAVGSELASAHAEMMLQSAYTMAKRYPRDEKAALEKLLARCSVPEFAEIAMYAKPQGTDADGRKVYLFGPSIRLAEAIVEALGNIYVDTHIVYDSPGAEKEAGKREIVTTAIDLEKNAIIRGPLIFEKAVERHSKADGIVPITTRTRLNGKRETTIYKLHATDAELRQIHFAMVSINVRNQTLRIVPREILFAAIKRVEETEAEAVKRNPSAALMAAVESFAKIGVKAAQLRAYFGHDLERLNPDELVLLRRLYRMIKDGHATWREVMSAEYEARAVEENERAHVRAEAEAKAKAHGAPPAPSAGQELAARLAARKHGRPRPSPAPRPVNGVPMPDRRDEDDEQRQDGFD